MIALPALVAAAVLAAPVWTTANSVATGDQDHPAVAANRAGDVAVVWADDREATDPATGDAHTEVFLRLFRDGTPVFEKKLSPGGAAGAAWRHVQPDVALDDQGDAVVVWAADPDGNGYYNIAYRVVSPSGAIQGSGYANASATGQQIHPRVAVDPDGVPRSPSAVAFTVVWQDVRGAGQASVRAAGFTSATRKAWEVTASPPTGAYHDPDVAVPASGGALVVWEQDAAGAVDIGLVGLARADGSVALSRRIANADAGGRQQHPAIAADFAGDFAVAWESDHTGTAGVWTRSFTAGGTPRGAEVETGAGGASPTIGIDDQADVVTGWTVPGADPDVYVRGLNPDGSSAGRLPGQVLSQSMTGRQADMAVAVSPFGEVAVAYTDDSDGNGFDQVVLGTGVSDAAW